MNKNDSQYDSEKLGVPEKLGVVSSSASRLEEDPTLLEPEETLHRGLKARQISMIGELCLICLPCCILKSKRL